MGTLVISTLILQSLGIVIAVPLLALASCLPVRRPARRWTAEEIEPRPAGRHEAMREPAVAGELPRAA